MRQWMLLALMAVFASASYAWTINSSGTYSLSGNLVLEDVIINASGVTLDCNNYSVGRPPSGVGSCYNAYSITSYYGDTTIKNCAIAGCTWAGFPYGGCAGASLNLAGDNNRIERVRFQSWYLATGRVLCGSSVSVSANSKNNVFIGLEAGSATSFSLNGMSNSTFINSGTGYTMQIQCNNCTFDNSGGSTPCGGYDLYGNCNLPVYPYSDFINSRDLVVKNYAPWVIAAHNVTNLLMDRSGAGWTYPNLINGSTNVEIRNSSLAWTVQDSTNTHITNSQPGVGYTIIRGSGLNVGSGHTIGLSITNLTSGVSSDGPVNFTGLYLERLAVPTTFTGNIGSLTLVNQSGIETHGYVNDITITDSYLNNFYGGGFTNNSSLMLNSFTSRRSQDIYIGGYVSRAYLNCYNHACNFQGYIVCDRTFTMTVKNGSSGIVFDNMTVLGDGLWSWGSWASIAPILNVEAGASDVTMKNSLINTTGNLIWNNNPTLVTLDQNAYAQTMFGTKNITGFVTGRTNPLLYVGIAGSDYPYAQNTSNASLGGAVAWLPGVCSTWGLPSNELINATDNAPLTWRRYSNGTLTVAIVSPAPNAYLGQSYTFPVSYRITAGVGLSNCRLMLKKDGAAGYETINIVPCGTGAGETISTSATVSSQGGGYTLTIFALDNSGAATDSHHISFYTNQTGGGGGTVCTDPNGCGGWWCNPDHPELCWQINQGNQSNPSYYDACVQSISQYGQNKSYIEKYLTCNFARLVGNAQMGGIMLALIVLGVFLAFVMMQNTRLDGKLVVMIPVIILVSVWMGWILWIVGFVIGAIIALAILRLITK